MFCNYDENLASEEKAYVVEISKPFTISGCLLQISSKQVHPKASKEPNALGI